MTAEPRGEDGPELFIPATGGNITGPVSVVGESGCTLTRPAVAPLGPQVITINIHGAAVGGTDIARIIREQLLQWNKRNGRSPTSA